VWERATKGRQQNALFSFVWFGNSIMMMVTVGVGVILVAMPTFRVVVMIDMPGF